MIFWPSKLALFCESGKAAQFQDFPIVTLNDLKLVSFLSAGPWLGVQAVASILLLQPSHQQPQEPPLGLPQ